MNPPPAEGLTSRLFSGPALRTQPDRRLVTLVRDGYDTAFEEIVRRYGRQLRAYAAAIVGGRSEDVTQDAFSKALLALRRDSEAEIDLKPWLYRIVRNTALNDLRDRPPDTDELVEALGSGSRSAAEEAERREEMSELLRRLQALPDPQRAAIVMRELEGLSHDEIAAALGLSGGAARQAIYRARQTLRDGLGALIPLPLLRALIEHGTEAGAAAGAGTGAAVAVGGAGAGTAVKVGVVTAVLAGSVGTGLAVEERGSANREDGAAAAAVVPEDAPTVRTLAGGSDPNRAAALARAPEGDDDGHGGAGPPAGVEKSSEIGVEPGARGNRGAPGHGPGPPDGPRGGRRGPRHGPFGQARNPKGAPPGAAHHPHPGGDRGPRGGGPRGEDGPGGGDEPRGGGHRGPRDPSYQPPEETLPPAPDGTQPEEGPEPGDGERDSRFPGPRGTGGQEGL